MIVSARFQVESPSGYLVSYECACCGESLLDMCGRTFWMKQNSQVQFSQGEFYNPWILLPYTEACTIRRLASLYTPCMQCYEDRALHGGPCVDDIAPEETG